MPTPLSERVRRHRTGLRAAGLRPVQVWVPDTRREGFAAECRRQSTPAARRPARAGSAGFGWSVAADTEGWR